MFVQIFGGGFVVHAKMRLEMGEADGFRGDEAGVDAALQFGGDDFGAAADDDAASEAGEFEDGVAGVMEDGPHGRVESEEFADERLHGGVFIFADVFGDLLREVGVFEDFADEVFVKDVHG